jgi:ATP-dependent Clp protease, protease subunit
VEQVRADSERDRWFTADQALAYGFVDQVVSRVTQVPNGAGPAPA